MDVNILIIVRSVLTGIILAIGVSIYLYFYDENKLD